MADFGHQTLTPQYDNVIYQDFCNRGVQQHQQINTLSVMQQIQLRRDPTTDHYTYSEPVNQQTPMYKTPTMQKQNYTKLATQKFTNYNPSTMQQNMHSGPAFQLHHEYRCPTVLNEMHHAQQPLQHTAIYKDFPHHERYPEILQSHENVLPNKICMSKRDLSTNNAGHTVQNYHKCDVCGKNFSCKSQLERHYLIHTGDKPFNCDECQKSFNDRSNLGRHLLTHTGETPYICEFCQQTFRTKGNLKSHNSTQTCKKPYEYDVQKNSTGIKNTNEDKNQKYQLNIDDYFDLQVIHFPKDSINNGITFPENDVYHGQALCNTFPIIDQRPNKTFENQPFESTSVSTMNPVIDQNIPYCLDGVNESTANLSLFSKK